MGEPRNRITNTTTKMNIELSESGRFLFETTGGTRSSGVVEELTETSALIRWDNTGNSAWYALTRLKSIAHGFPEYRIIEKLKPRLTY